MDAGLRVCGEPALKGNPAVRAIRRAARVERLVRCVAVIGGAAAAIVSGGCGARGPGAQPYPQFEEFTDRKIEDVRFANAAPFSADTLQMLVETKPSRCNLLGLPVCIPFTHLGEEEHFLDLTTLQEDVQRLTLFYRQSGFFNAEVIPEVEPVKEEQVAVTFWITPGQPVYTAALTVEGTEGILAPDSLAAILPLQPGDLFDLGEFNASADTVLRALRAKGYAYANVLRNYTVAPPASGATAWLVGVPGPQVFVDSVVVFGAEHLGREATLQQLTFRKGDLLLATELAESQRNLYDLDLVQVASVSPARDTIAPEEAGPPLVAPAPPTPGLPPALAGTALDSVGATVVVRISEAPVHAVEAAVGFGTVDCVRTRASWVDRSFGGAGARRLALTGSVSKIGIAQGLGGVCNAFEGDPFRNVLDYRLSGELTQPYVVSPRNRLTLAAFAERQSEPNVFQRTAQGGRLALTRRMATRSFLTAAIDAERRKILATPVLFCAALLVCSPEDIEALSRPRWGNALTLNWLTDRGAPALDPVEGYRLATGLDWNTRWLGSTSEYLRWTAEGSVYERVRPQWVLAGRLWLGSFLGGATVEPDGSAFVPPEDRFFAGGATTVRGFERNRLGPGVYVADSAIVNPATGFPLPADSSAIEFFPTGGTAVIVASAELRVPSPFLRERLRLAAFVDAGAVGTNRLWDLDAGDLRFTPGMGIRLATPIGPVRLDLAYDPYGPTVGPLFVPAPETGELVRIDPAFAPETGGLLDRLRLHLAVGQPF